MTTYRRPPTGTVQADVLFWCEEQARTHGIPTVAVSPGLLALTLGVPERSVTRALRWLRREGWLVVVQRGVTSHPTRYRLAHLHDDAR